MWNLHIINVNSSTNEYLYCPYSTGKLSLMFVVHHTAICKWDFRLAFSSQLLLRYVCFSQGETSLTVVKVLHGQWFPLPHEKMVGPQNELGESQGTGRASKSAWRASNWARRVLWLPVTKCALCCLSRCYPSVITSSSSSNISGSSNSSSSSIRSRNSSSSSSIPAFFRRLVDASLATCSCADWKKW